MEATVGGYRARISGMTALLETPVVGGCGEKLKPYVPRLLIEWMRDTPEARYPGDRRLAARLRSFTSPALRRSASPGRARSARGADARHPRRGLHGLLDSALRLGRRRCSSGAATHSCSSSTGPSASRAAAPAGRCSGRSSGSGGCTSPAARSCFGCRSGIIDRNARLLQSAGSVHRELLISRPGGDRDGRDRGDRGCGRDRAQPGDGCALDPRMHRPAKEQALRSSRPPGCGARPRARRRRCVDGIDIASCIPIAARHTSCSSAASRSTARSPRRSST